MILHHDPAALHPPPTPANPAGGPLLQNAGAGFGYLALAGMLGMQSRPASGSPGQPAAGPLVPKPQQIPAKAKRIIFLFMEGAMSAVDTFDYKPKLQEEPRQAGPGGGKLVPSKFQFAQHGAVGDLGLELYPNVARTSTSSASSGVSTDTPAHPQAVMQLHRHRDRLADPPSMGA